MSWHDPVALAEATDPSRIDVIARKVAAAIVEARLDDLVNFEQAVYAFDAQGQGGNAALNALAAVAGGVVGRLQAASRTRAAAALLGREPVRKVAEQIRDTPRKPTAVAEATGMDLAQVSRALKQLREAGLAYCWSHGKTRPHSLSPSGRRLLEQAEEHERRGGRQMRLEVELARVELEEAIDQLELVGQDSSPVKAYVLGAAIELARALLTRPSDDWTPEDQLLARLLCRCPLQDTNDDKDVRFLHHVTQAWPGNPGDPRLELLSCVYELQFASNHEQVMRRMDDLGPRLLEQGVAPWADLWASTTIEICSLDGRPPRQNARALLRHLAHSSALDSPLRDALLARAQVSLGRVPTSEIPSGPRQQESAQALPRAIRAVAESDLASIKEHESLYSAREELSRILRTWLASVPDTPSALLADVPSESVPSGDIEWLWEHKDQLRIGLHRYFTNKRKERLCHLDDTLRGFSRREPVLGRSSWHTLEKEVLAGMVGEGKPPKALNTDQFRALTREAPAPLVVVRSLVGR